MLLLLQLSSLGGAIAAAGYDTPSNGLWTIQDSRCRRDSIPLQPAVSLRVFLHTISLYYHQKSDNEAQSSEEPHMSSNTQQVCVR